MQSLLTTMGDVLTSMPLAGLVPFVFFGLLWAISGLKAVLATAVLWFAYSGYEYLMQAKVLCSGECNIRLDLFAIYPFLLLISTLAILVFAFWAARRHLRRTK